MALHKKWDLLASLQADVVVAQECAAPEILVKAGFRFDDQTACWVKPYLGSANKGLGVFAAPGWSLRVPPVYQELLERWSDRLDLILPVEVSGPIRFNLLAVWSFNNRQRKDKRRIEGPVLLALQELNAWMRETPTVVIGDFNHNVIWDTKTGKNNFQTAIERLEARGLRSAYHELRGEAFGKESVPTHYWRDIKEDGPTYHIDYAFVPTDWLEKCQHFEVGSFTEWCGSEKSDHVPLILECRLTDEGELG